MHVDEIERVKALPVFVLRWNVFSFFTSRRDAYWSLGLPLQCSALPYPQTYININTNHNAFLMTELQKKIKEFLSKCWIIKTLMLKINWCIYKIPPTHTPMHLTWQTIIKSKEESPHEIPCRDLDCHLHFIVIIIHSTVYLAISHWIHFTHLTFLQSAFSLFYLHTLINILINPFCQQFQTKTRLIDRLFIYPPTYLPPSSRES